MLSMGFERELSAILERLPKTRQTLLFSATLPPDIERMARIIKALALPIEGWLVPFVRRLAEGQDVVLGSVDVGRAKWVERMASRLGVSAAFAHKRRLGPDRTEVVALLADVKDRHVILMDDMIRSGSSMLGAAAAYRAAGARRVSAYATHGVLPGDALARLEASGLLTHLTTTDSHPSALRQAGAFLEVLTIAPWLAAHLGDAHSTISPERTVAIGTVP